jgi:hypothetical protein
MKIEIMTGRGHELLAEVDVRTHEDELREVFAEVDRLLAQGYSAFSARTQAKIARLDQPIDEDVVLVAPVAGG